MLKRFDKNVTIKDQQMSAQGQQGSQGLAQAFGNRMAEVEVVLEQDVLIGHLGTREGTKGSPKLKIDHVKRKAFVVVGYLEIRMTGFMGTKREEKWHEEWVVRDVT